MLKHWIEGRMSRLLLVFAIFIAMGPANAQEAAAQLFTPPGMPALTAPGSVLILPSAAIDSTASPFTAERRLEMIAARQAAKKRGWTDVTETQANRVDSYFDRPEQRSRMRALREISSELRLMPALLEGTALDKAEPLGASVSGAFTDSGWTGLVRAFTAPKLGRVVLEEFDYAAAGTQITVMQEMIDGGVNGLPLITDTYRAPSGKGYTEFTWFTANKQFILRVGRYIPENDELRPYIQALMPQLL